MEPGGREAIDGSDAGRTLLLFEDGGAGFGATEGTGRRTPGAEGGNIDALFCA